MDQKVEKVLQIENGLAVKISREECQKVGYVKSGYFAVDGKQLLDMQSDVLRERKKLQETGIVVISMAIDISLKIINKPKINCIGSFDLKNDRETLQYLEREVTNIVNNKSRELIRDSGSQKKQLFNIDFLKKKKGKIDSKKIVNELEKSTRSRVIKIFEDIMGKRPVTEVYIHFIE